MRHSTYYKGFEVFYEPPPIRVVVSEQRGRSCEFPFARPSPPRD